MNNNDILRKIRYIFDYNDSKMLNIFKSTGKEVSIEQLSNWLKKDEDENFVGIYDIDLASFLNGFINENRGKREGEQAKPEKTLTNNIILRKLKIALNLKTEDIIDILDLADLTFSKHELTAFFRKPSQKQFRMCKDQFLRNFLFGLQLKYRK